MLASARILETDELSAPRTRGARPTQRYGHFQLGRRTSSYGHSELGDDEHTEVVVRDGETQRIPGRYRDYLMIAIISLNLAAFGVILFVAVGQL